MTNNNLLCVHISTKSHKKVAKWECWSSDPSHVYFHTAAVISPTHNLLWWKNIRRVRLEIKAESNFQKKLDCSEEEVCCCHSCVIIGQSCHFWAVTLWHCDSDRRGLSQVNWGGIEKYQWLLWCHVNYYFRKKGLAALFEKWTQLDNCKEAALIKWQGGFSLMKKYQENEVEGRWMMGVWGSKVSKSERSEWWTACRMLLAGWEEVSIS